MISIKYVTWAALAGGLIPVMGVLNARLGSTLGNPLHAPVVLLFLAFATSFLACLALTYKLPDLGSLTSARPLELAGGMIVCFYVFSATLLAPRMGIGDFILFAVAAQIITSAAIDHFGLFGAIVKELSLIRLGGLLLLISGLITTQMAKA